MQENSRTEQRNSNHKDTKELTLYFSVILRALCVFVVVVAFLLGCGRCSRCVKTMIPLHAIPAVQNVTPPAALQAL